MVTTTHNLIRFQPDFQSWLRAARHLLQQGIAPADVEWLETADPLKVTPLPDAPPMRFNDTFLSLARRASFHNSSERWGILYRVLWRLVHGQSRLLNELLDPDVTRLHTLARDVEKEVRHLVTTVHFTAMETERGAVRIAWFIPRHHIVELAAPQIARKLGGGLWSLLTPDLCAHWNGRQLTYSPGEKRIAAGSPHQLESLWRAHCAGRFDLKPETNQRETKPALPRENWENLPLFRSHTKRTGHSEIPFIKGIGNE